MLKKIISAVMAFALVITGIQITVSDNANKVQAADSEWQLVWSDDFEGTSLDTNAWNYDIGAGGWGNEEIQYYTDKSDNVSVSDGFLKITAKKESYNGSSYTSGRLTTKGKKAFKYGKMEARIKVEGGNQNGVWPAFWMMGNDGSSWPYCGELDIMEHANNRNYVEGTIHWNAGGMNAAFNHVYWGSYSNGNYYYFNDNVNNGINGWHTYGVLWDEEKIQWYVDDNVYLTAYLTSDNAYAFQKEQYFLLNLALGGTGTPYTGNTTVDADFQSATMYVDYVKAYQGGSTEISTPADGLTATTTEKTDLGGFGYYFLGGNTGRYSGGTTLDEEFTLKVTNNNKAAWGVQAFTKNIAVTSGHKYNVSVDINSDNATGAVLMKDEIGGTEFVNQNLVAGNNTLTGTFTASSDNMQFMFNLTEVNAGTTLKFSNVKVTDITGSEPAETTTVQSGGNESTDYSKLNYTENSNSEFAVAPLEDYPLQSVNFLADGRVEVILGVNQGSYPIFPDFTNVTLNGTSIPQGYYGAGAAFYIPANGEGLKYNDYNVIEATSAVNSNKFHIIVRYGTPGAVTPETTVAETTTQEPTTPEPTTLAPETTTQSQVTGDWKAIPAEDTNVGAWILYAANDTWQTGTMSYQGGTTDSDLKLQIVKSAGEPGCWGLQAKYPLTLTEGKEYKVVVNYTASKAGKIHFKIDGPETAQTFDAVEGTNTSELTVIATAANTAVLELSGFAAGTEIAVTGVRATSVEEPTTEAPTQEPTTQAPDPGVVTSSDIDVLGYQISTTSEGLRVAAMVEPQINGKSVNKWGFVYGLNTLKGNTTGITDDDMVVGSTNKFIHSYESTSTGTLNVKMGDSDTATYYARTMLFGSKSIAELTAQYKVRAYAILEDGSYVYSSISQYSTNQVADYLYKNKLMNTITAHNYLYENILRIVDSSYAEIDYSWNNSIVKPDLINE